ncbi:pentatricopeptide repeat-containing protein At1g62914, mitochondrial-like [Euphorbia lathyris]|uniref:pentatricopeptide repeat-containing protein At1g62914, mitochondrial-like n=1 Tax=Euphorbia lathyris TaxID=212925 RepID=UPI003313CD11
MLSRLTLSKRIPKWVSLKPNLSSISSTSSILIKPDIDQTIPNLTDFEAKIQSLNNKLHPDSLIRVLQSTSDIDSALKIFKWASHQKRFTHTTETYYWMIFKLGLAGNVAEMEGFCQILVKNSFPGVEHALISLVESFVRHCRLNEAICILVNMNSGGFSPPISLFNVVLEAIVEAKRGFGDAVFVYKEMVKAGVVPNVDTLNYLLEVLFESKKVDSALDQYKRMNKKGFDPNSKTFEIVVKGLVVNDRVNDSLVVLQDMLELGCVPELSFYICVIPLFCRENKPEEAMRLFTMMCKSNFLPNSCIYNTLIRCLCDNLWFDKAVNLLEEMSRSCLIPDNDVLVTVVNQFCKLGKIGEASKLLEDNNFFETSPFNELLRGCCDAGSFFTARVILEKMSARSIDDCDSWNILIRWLCEKAETRKGCELLGRMVLSSLVPDCDTYTALILGYCRSSKPEDALRLFFQFCAKCYVLDSVSYSELIELLCRMKKYPDATRVFRYMYANGCSLQSTAFSMLTEGICSNGMVSEAIRLQRMSYNSGALCENSTYNSILLGLSKSNTKQNLSVFLSQMLVKGCNLDTEAYCIMIQSTIAQNRTKDCALFFNNMVNEGGLVPDSATLHNLLLYLSNESQLYMIISSVNRLVTETEVIDSKMYNVLINGLLKEGCKIEASRLLDLMLEKGWVPDSITHRLLIGSVDRKGSDDGKMLNCKNFEIKDCVSDILADGLETHDIEPT